ncbi:MAG: maleylpyruvate isomerase N-terminal domain-containing protein [Acidimicrobiales bacterium]
MPASDFVETTYPELEARIDAAYDRFTDLVGRVAQDQPVGPTWTARDVVAHVLCVVNRYTAFEPGRLAETPRGVDAINQRELEEHVGRSTTELLEVLADEMARFRGQWGAGSGLPLDLALPFHGSTTIDLQSGLTNLIGEYLVHGRDVAEASTVPWAIDDRDGALLCGFATQLLPSYVRAANDVRLSLRFDLDGVAPGCSTSMDRPPPAAPPTPPTSPTSSCADRRHRPRCSSTAGWTWARPTASASASSAAPTPTTPTGSPSCSRRRDPRLRRPIERSGRPSGDRGPPREVACGGRGRPTRW